MSRSLLVLMTLATALQVGEKACHSEASLYGNRVHSLLDKSSDPEGGQETAPGDPAIGKRRQRGRIHIGMGCWFRCGGTAKPQPVTPLPPAPAKGALKKGTGASDSRKGVTWSAEVEDQTARGTLPVRAGDPLGWPAMVSQMATNPEGLYALVARMQNEPAEYLLGLTQESCCLVKAYDCQLNQCQMKEPMWSDNLSCVDGECDACECDRAKGRVKATEKKLKVLKKSGAKKLYTPFEDLSQEYVSFEHGLVENLPSQPGCCAFKAIDCKQCDGIFLNLRLPYLECEKECTCTGDGGDCQKCQ